MHLDAEHKPDAFLVEGRLRRIDVHWHSPGNHSVHPRDILADPRRKSDQPRDRAGALLEFLPTGWGIPPPETRRVRNGEFINTSSFPMGLQEPPDTVGCDDAWNVVAASALEATWHALGCFLGVGLTPGNQVFHWAGSAEPALASTPRSVPRPAPASTVPSPSNDLFRHRR